MKVFILDDNRELADAMKESLEKYSNQFEVTVAYSGKTVLEMLPVNMPDVMLIDINLPDMNGLEIMREVKEIEPDVQVIIMSAYASMPNIIKALQYGALDFIQKPVHMKQIYTALKSATERRNILLDTRKAVAELIKVKESKIEQDHTFALLDRIIILKKFQQKLNYITTEENLLKNVIDEYKTLFNTKKVTLYKELPDEIYMLASDDNNDGKKVRIKSDNVLHEQAVMQKVGGFLNERKSIVSVISFEDYTLGFIKCDRDIEFKQYELELAEMLSIEIAAKANQIEHAKRIDSQMLGITFALMSLVGVKNPQLKRVFENVSNISSCFGEYIKIPFSEVEKIRYTALMYNLIQGETIANFDIDKDVLNETINGLAGGISGSMPEKLINEKLNEITQQMEFLEDTKELLYAVNEHYDGSGPQGLKGGKIPLNARIIAITNTFVNIASKKDYREGLEMLDVLNMMEEEKGKYFDPELFENFKSFLADKYNAHEVYTV